MSVARSDPAVRRIGAGDLRSALAKGYADVMDTPNHLLILGEICPIVGFMAGRAASDGALLPLLYPLVAVRTSVRAICRNSIRMAYWGLIVAVFLLLGCLPFFIGLAEVMPVLGHATWHVYRRLVEIWHPREAVEWNCRTTVSPSRTRSSAAASAACSPIRTP